MKMSAHGRDMGSAQARAHARVRARALVGVLVGVAVAACGGTAPPAIQPAASNLIHSPPVSKLSDQQLRALSMDCEKYVPENTTRGPYDAAYCEAAMAAWADAPIQMLPFEKNAAPSPSSAPPR
jgi:hypothetical protein